MAPVIKLDNIPPGTICVIKDLDYRISSLSHQAAKVLGWKNPDVALGAIDYDIPCKAVEMADEYLKLDKLSITNNCKIVSIEVQQNFLGWCVYMCERNPIQDVNNATLCLSSMAMDITNTKLGMGFFHK